MTGDGAAPRAGGGCELVPYTMIDTLWTEPPEPPMSAVALGVVLTVGAVVWVLAGIGVVALVGGLR
jgi:hypothetical protein